MEKEKGRERGRRGREGVKESDRISSDRIFFFLSPPS